MTRPSVILLALTAALAMNLTLAQSAVVWQGGISEDERTLAPESGSRLVFFVSTGSFLSQVGLTISNSGGNEVVNITTEGPWVYINLPDGIYDVRATRRNGDMQSLKIEIDSSLEQEFGFMFPGS